MRKEDPKYVEKRKKFMAMQKEKSQDKFSKGGLSPKQKVIAAKAPPPNKITGADFAALKKEKAGKVKPIKAVLGIAAMGLMGAKMLKDKNKKAMALPGVGAAALMAKKKKEILGKKRGGMGDATEYKKYLKGLKAASSSQKPKKTYSSMEEMRKAKGFKPGETPSEFNKRRMALEAGKKAVKGTRIGKILLPIVGAGVAAQQFLKSKMKKDKKMGGGMMRRYTKGGGADMSKESTSKMKASETAKTYALAQSMKNKDRLTERDIAQAKKIISKKMGGGMMQKPMGYVGGGPAEESDLAKRSKIRNARGQNPIRPRGPAGRAASGPRKMDDILKNYKKFTDSDSGVIIVTKDRDKVKKMGGGMMNKPMGYKSGKSIKVKCKLGKNKPTKMY